MTRLHAIVVTFNPKLDVLLRELERTIPQVEQIWIVDNGSSKSLAIWISSLNLANKLQLIQMSDNLGLGVAQNAGIKRACSDGASHVLILDQDSQPMPDMVERLLAESMKLESDGVSVAAVAPVYADSETGPASGFVSLSWFGYKKQPFLPRQKFVEADFVISSGTLILASALEEIGPMDESLFIDHVDTEWCFRARSKGFRLFGVPGARMVHLLGDRRKRIWFLRWRNVAFHSPFRYYYIFRNGLLLQKRAYIPMKWKTAEFFRAIRLCLFFGFWGKGAKERRRMMWLGIVDGWSGIVGPLNESHTRIF